MSVCIRRMNKYRCDSNKLNKDESVLGSDDKTKLMGPNKKLTTMWRYFIGDQAFSAKPGNSKTNKNTSESVIGTAFNNYILDLMSSKIYASFVMTYFHYNRTQ